MTDIASVAVLAGGLEPTGSFDAACELVVDHLSRAMPMGLWAVTRVADDRQIMLTVDSPGYPTVSAGLELPFRSSLCAQMVMGRAPAVAPDVDAATSYTAAVASAERLGFPIGAYAGAPILAPSGELFGTVCGYDTTAAAGLSEATEPLLAVFAALLTVVLGTDLAVTAAHRETERAWAFADIDELTGLLNRRGWDRLLQREESRFRRFGETATVIVIAADRFSSVNDAHGRDAGDHLLRAVAFVLRTTARGSDVVARLGGDQFGIIAVGTGRVEAATFVRRLEHALADTGVRFSTGAAPHTVAGGLAVAWRQAETAMHAHKQRRRDPTGTPDPPSGPHPTG